MEPKLARYSRGRRICKSTPARKTGASGKEAGRAAATAAASVEYLWHLLCGVIYLLLGENNVLRALVGSVNFGNQDTGVVLGSNMDTGFDCKGDDAKLVPHLF